MVRRPGRGSVWIRVAIAGMALLSLLVILAIRERFEPWLSLYLDDVIDPKPNPHRVALREDVALLLYEDTRPHIGKIDALQKGLVLVHRNKRLVEEAYGFGLPLVLYDEGAYNARQATVSRPSDRVLVKRYTLDTLDRPARFLRRKYQPVPPVGTVTVTSTVRPPDAIDVTVDLRELLVGWEAAYLMNEQGARAFTRYRSPEGRVLTGGTVGIWDEAVAPFGCWESSAADLRFCVDAEAGQPGFVGRERYVQYHAMGIYQLSWAGIDLEIHPPTSSVSYTIRVEDVSVDP
jgi:hypothetical protein